jgi:hypothetical protein
MANDEWQLIDHSVNVGLTTAWQWSVAVHAQAERVANGSGARRVPDAYLLVLAVRNVRRAAEMVKNTVRTTGASVQMSAALERFDNALPGITKIRDVLEHFDDYARGVGNDQQPGVKKGQRVPDEQLAMSYTINFESVSPDPRQFRIRIGTHVVELTQAPLAARNLVRDIHSTLTAEEAGEAAT